MGRNTTTQQLTSITESLARIEAALAARVPVADVKRAIEDTSATAEVAQQLSQVAPVVAAQLDSIVTTLDAQMTDDELRGELRNTLSYIRQFTPIMQGTRDDIVLLRADFRRLSALLEQTLHVRIEDEERGIVWNVGDADRRKAG